MSLRWLWRRPALVNGPNRAAHVPRSRQVWADLTYLEAVIAQAAEVAAVQAGELAALERVLNQPTMVFGRGVRVPPLLLVYRRAGRWGVRHA